jgi:hypothetical protein
MSKEIIMMIGWGRQRSIRSVVAIGQRRNIIMKRRRKIRVLAQERNIMSS